MCYDLLVFTLLAHYYHIFKIYLFIYFFKQSCNNKCNQNYKYIKNICLGPSDTNLFLLVFLS